METSIDIVQNDIPRQNTFQKHIIDHKSVPIKYNY